MAKNTVPEANLLLIKDNKILLLRRFNTGYEDGKYCLVSGHIEDGESFSQGIIREAQEEAGITVKSEDLRAVHVQHRDSGSKVNNQRIALFFEAKHWSGEIKNNEPHKCDDISWFDLDNLPENIVPSVKDAIDAILSQKIYSEHGWKLQP